jgi:hypothetical protein
MDETRAVARLPGLDVEITRRVPDDGSAEQLLIAMRATPSFAAFGEALSPAMLVMAPMALWRGWFELARLAWAPWLAVPPLAHGANAPPRGRDRAARPPR